MLLEVGEVVESLGCLHIGELMLELTGLDVVGVDHLVDACNMCLKVVFCFPYFRVPKHCKETLEMLAPL